MKNLVRAIAFSLVLTGAAASAHIANASSPLVGRSVSAIPVPTCPPDDPTGCGMCQANGKLPSVKKLLESSPLG